MTSTNQQERRQCSRKTLNPLPYINLPFDNGGIVLDVSEQGLRFRATSPVELSGPIPFWFTAHSDLISGEAELMWLDETKKIGGLRFIQLPQNACEQIRSWPADPDLRPSIGEDMTLHIAAPELPSTPWGKIWHTLAARASSAARQIEELRRDLVAAARADVRPVVERALAKLRALGSPRGLKENRRALLQTAAVLSVVLISALSYVQRRPFGESLIRLGMKMSGETRPLAVASASGALQQNVRDNPADISSAPALPAEAALPPASQVAATSVPATSVPTTSATENQADAPASQVPFSNSSVRKSRAGGKKIFVQVAALTEQTEARELADQLKRENFRAFVRTLPDDSLNRVVLGPYPDPASARADLGKLKKAGFDSFIRRESAAEWLGS
jgi:cell division septation protein DedD